MKSARPSPAADNSDLLRRTFDPAGEKTNAEKGKFVFQQVLGNLPENFFDDRTMEVLYQELQPQEVTKEKALEELRRIFAKEENSPFSFEEEHLFPRDKPLPEAGAALLAEEKEEVKEEPLPYHKPSFHLRSTQDAIMACYQEPGLILPTVVIFANDVWIGGQDIWPRTAAQEEAIFLHSDIRKRKPYNFHNKHGYNCYITAEEYLADQGEGYANEQRGFNYFGGAYVLKHVKLFFHQKRILSENNRPEFNALFVAAPNFKLDYVREYYSNQNGLKLYIRQMAKCFDAQYELALEAHEGEGKPRLIAGALGCGDFCNNPYIIAYLQVLILQKSCYRDRLEVEFDLIPPWNYKGDIRRHADDHNQTAQNAYAFNFVIDNFEDLSKMPSFQAIQKMVDGHDTQGFENLLALENQCKKDAKLCGEAKILSHQQVEEAHQNMGGVLETLDVLWKSGQVSRQTKAHLEKELWDLKKATQDFKYVEKTRVKHFKKNIQALALPKTLQASLAVFLISLAALTAAVVFTPLATGLAVGVALTEGFGLFAVVKSGMHLHAITKHQHALEDTPLKESLTNFTNHLDFKSKS